MRVSLVNVQFHEGNNIFPPLGILYVGAALRQAGHTVQLLDGDPWVRTDLSQRVVDFAPDWIGVSLMTMTFDRAQDLIRQLRTLLPGVPIIGGGAHPTADPAGALEDLDLDAVAVGEGEATAVDIAAALARGDTLDGLPGVHTAAGCVDRPPIEDLDALAPPARDLLGHEPYLRPPGLIRGMASSRIASMLASRGCPFACSFCASKQQLGRAVRIRSVGNVLAELDHLVEVDRIRGMYWVDDVFTYHRDWVLEFCAALSRRPYRLMWACQARVNQVDGALLRAMRDAGCVQVDYGVESGSPAMLKQMKKGIRRQEVIEAFSLTQSLGLRTGASFVLGSPGETAEDIALTADLARRIRSDWTVFFFSTPYPGTPLWKRTRAWRQRYPSYGEAWNNRVSTTPFPQGAVDGQTLATARARLQNRHFRRNYLRWHNVPFMLRLVPTLQEPVVRRTAWQVATRRGRLDDLVEAAFSHWRAP